MRRFIVTYRWEFWLLLWAPLLGGLVVSAASPLLNLLNDRGWSSYYVLSALGSMVQAGLLLVLYAWVRRLERGFLTLVWRYALLLAAIGGLLSLLGLVLSIAFGEPGSFRYALLVTAMALAGFIVTLPLLFWFARRASRFSLAHAFFLFLVMEKYGLAALLAPWIVDLVPWDLLSPVLLLISLAFSFVMGFLLAWLLGNFESRSDAFRKRVVGVLLAVYVVFSASGQVELVVSLFSRDTSLLEALASDLAGLLLPSTFVILPLALIYLARVRQPAPAAEPPTDLRVQ